jgi:hypothetical protein
MFIGPTFPDRNGMLKAPPPFNRRDPRGGVLHKDEQT